MNKSKLTPAQKREQTLRAKLIEYIRTHPGCSAFEVPKGTGRLLRRLEKEEGVLEYSDGWRVRPTCSVCGRVMTADEVGDEFPDERVCDQCAMK